VILIRHLNGSSVARITICIHIPFPPGVDFIDWNGHSFLSLTYFRRGTAFLYTLRKRKRRACR
jgi:hypothetical protein